MEAGATVLLQKRCCRYERAIRRVPCGFRQIVEVPDRALLAFHLERRVRFEADFSSGRWKVPVNWLFRTGIPGPLFEIGRS